MVKKCPPQYSVQLFFVFWDKPQIHNLPKPEQSRQEVFNKGAYTFVQEDLTFKNLAKSPLICSVSFAIWGALSFVWWDKPVKDPWRREYPKPLSMRSTL